MKFRLVRYAEFIQATTSYVVLETLNRVFDKDHDFRAWLQQHPESTLALETETESRMETENES